MRNSGLLGFVIIACVSKLIACGGSGDSSTTDANTGGSTASGGGAGATTSTGTSTTTSTSTSTSTSGGGNGAGGGAPTTDFILAMTSRRAHDGGPSVWFWHSKDKSYTQLPNSNPCGALSMTPNGNYVACDMILKGPAIFDRAAKTVVYPPIIEPTGCSAPVLDPAAQNVFCTAYFRENILGWQIWTFPIAGGADHAITQEGTNRVWPAMRPDGAKLAVQLGQAIGDMSLDGSSERELVPNAKPNNSVLTQPAYDRDSKRIVYMDCGPGMQGLDSCDLALVSADGGAPEMLTSQPSLKNGPIFSLDGAKIYYLESTSKTLQNVMELDLQTKAISVLVSDIHDADQVGVSGSQTMAIAVDQ
jgi:hypothetical protein